MPKYDLTPNVARLLTLGNPDKYQDQTIEISIQPEDIPSLIHVLEDHELRWESPEDSTYIYAAIYAWRAVAYLKAEAAIPALIGLLSAVDEEYDEWAQDELPEVFESIGPACVPALVEFLQIPPKGGDVWGAGTAIDGLQKIASRYPETRQDCIATFTALLENFAEGDELFNAMIILAAADLKAVEMVPLVERAYAAERVDEGLLGDWEDFQVKAGILKERVNPKRKWGWNLRFDESEEEDRDEDFEDVDLEDEDVEDTDHTLPDWTPELRQQVKKSDKKAKNKRKQEKKSRKKNRKKK